MHALAQLGQDAAQAVGGHAPHGRRMGGLHPLEQLGGGKGQHLLRIIPFRGKAETKTEHLFFGHVLVEQGVVLLDSLLLFFIEPAAFAGQQFRLELGVQLLMLHGGGAVYGMFQTDAEEAARAGTVHQQVFPLSLIHI